VPQGAALPRGFLSHEVAGFGAVPKSATLGVEPFLALNTEAPITTSEKQYLVSAGLARNCRFFLVEHAGPRPGAFAPSGTSSELIKRIPYHLMVGFIAHRWRHAG
jgi:hypothetical protein